MKIKIQIKNRFTGSVIFEYESENNTMKETIKEFIRQELASGKSYADLSSADLSYADLSYANLSYANLRSANLRSADLSYANLSYANLRSADLRSADLSSADLSYANLSYAKNKETAYIPLNCKWSFTIKGDLIQIGCKEKTIKEWDAFFKSKEVYSTGRGTEEFKQIEAVYKACKAYLQHLSK
jgi:hypothetical protein